MFKRAKTKLNILPVSFKRNGKHYSNNKLFKQDQKDLKKLQTELSKKSIKPNDLKSNNYFKGSKTYFLKVGFLLYRNIIFMVLKIMKINF